MTRAITLAAALSFAAMPLFADSTVPLNTLSAGQSQTVLLGQAEAGGAAAGGGGAGGAAAGAGAGAGAAGGAAALGGISAATIAGVAVAAAVGLAAALGNDSDGTTTTDNAN